MKLKLEKNNSFLLYLFCSLIEYMGFVNVNANQETRIYFFKVGWHVLNLKIMQLLSRCRHVKIEFIKKGFHEHLFCQFCFNLVTPLFGLALCNFIVMSCG